MNKLCKDFCREIINKFNHLKPVIIFYGSNIYNENSSDLDVCIIVDYINKTNKLELINFTSSFQRERNLRIDEEIPFTNKLVFTKAEIDNVFNESPFIRDGVYKLDQIKKSKRFLNSKIMKKRLFLNILTTDHKIYNGKKKYFKQIEKRAWFTILDMLINVFKTNLKNLHEVLDHLNVNPISNYAGEMHLGYKLGNKKKKKYLIKKIKYYCNLYVKEVDKL